MLNSARKTLCEPDLKRLEKVLELVGDDPKKVESIIRSVMRGEAGIKAVARSRWQYVLHELRRYTKEHLREVEKKRLRELPRLEQVFGEEKARRMRREAMLRDLSTPDSSR